MYIHVLVYVCMCMCMCVYAFVYMYIKTTVYCNSKNKIIILNDTTEKKLKKTMVCM